MQRKEGLTSVSVCWEVMLCDWPRPEDCVPGVGRESRLRWDLPSVQAVVHGKLE